LLCLGSSLGRPWVASFSTYFVVRSLDVPWVVLGSSLGRLFFDLFRGEKLGCALGRPWVVSFLIYSVVKSFVVLWVVLGSSLGRLFFDLFRG